MLSPVHNSTSYHSCFSDLEQTTASFGAVCQTHSHPEMSTKIVFPVTQISAESRAQNLMDIWETAFFFGWKYATITEGCGWSLANPLGCVCADVHAKEWNT